MMTRHTFLLTAGALLAALGTTFSSAAMADRNAPQTETLSRTSQEDAKPTAPSRIRSTGGTEIRDRAGAVQRPGQITQGSRAQSSNAKPSSSGRNAADGKADAGASKAPTLGNGNGDPSLVPNLDIQVNSDNRVVVRDRDTDRVIIDTRNLGLWSTAGYNSSSKHWIKPTVRVIPTADGFDVEYDFVNNTGQPGLVGAFNVPGINMPNSIQTRRFNLDMHPMTVTRQAAKHQNWSSREYRYPDELYAPVMLFGDDEYLIGVSVQYPIIEYSHSINTQFRSYAYDGGNDTFWMARMHGSMEYDSKTDSTEEGSIKPGEQRRYTLSMRIIKNRAGDHPNRWLQTFVPYREYFQSMYGGVKYERDPRPIQHLLMAARELNSNRDYNPRSYTYAGSRAPDRFGFGPWAQVIRERMDAGMERFNMVGISGAMWEHKGHNAPFLIGTPFFNEPAMAIARDTTHELVSLKEDGADLGFWWGRSSRVMWGWDTGLAEPLDPEIPSHYQAAIAEIEAARKMGCSTLGLDAFEYLPAWKSYPYLRSLQEQYPDMKFVIEPMSADLLHTIAPGFVFLTRPESQKTYAVERANALADFLVPGHETWGIILSAPFYQKGLAQPGKGVPDSELRKVAERGAADGYSVLLFGSPDIRGWNVMAAESWHTSVPDDLKRN